jgi:hypothetical protein
MLGDHGSKVGGFQRGKDSDLQRESASDLMFCQDERSCNRLQRVAIFPVFRPKRPVESRLAPKMHRTRRSCCSLCVEKRRVPADFFQTAFDTTSGANSPHSKAAAFEVQRQFGRVTDPPPFDLSKSGIVIKCGLNSKSMFLGKDDNKVS